MRTYRFGQFGLEHLQLDNLEQHDPGPHEVALDVKALSLNYRDLLVIRGQYNPKLQLPATPVSDAAGVVAAVGRGVTRVKPGDKVCTHFVAGWIDGPFRRNYPETSLGTPGPGLACERAILPAEAVVPIPAGYTFAQAATLPIAALTAWSSLRTVFGDPFAPAQTRGGAAPDPEFVKDAWQRPGAATPAPAEPPKTVLTLGTGGVSVFALQLGKALGARVIITSSSDEKLARARELGADHAINYKRTPDWSRAVLEATGGEGADVVVETGGAGTFDQSMKSTRAGGTVAMLGALTGTRAEVTTGLILMRRLTIQGIYVDSRRRFEELIRFIEQRALRPVIGATFHFDQLGEALRYMEAGLHFGKIVIEV